MMIAMLRVTSCMTASTGICMGKRREKKRRERGDREGGITRVTLLRVWSAQRSWSFKGLPTMSDPLIASIMLASVTGCESTWGGGLRFIPSPGGLSKFENHQVGAGYDGIYSAVERCLPANYRDAADCAGVGMRQIVSPIFSAR